MSAYVGDRVVFDADSHLMELPGWLEQYADSYTRERLRPLALGGAGALAETAVAQAAARVNEPASEMGDGRSLLATKGWSAVGAFDPHERSRVLDVLGFSAQLVFPTFAATQFAPRPGQDADIDLLYGGADALNRAIADFCASDARLLAVGWVPWADPVCTIGSARRAIEAGCRAIQVPTDLPRGVVSPTHPDHDGLWALLEESGVPVVSHVGGGGRPVRPGFHKNGRPVSDFLGGGENVRSKDYLAIHQRPEVFWGALVLDGIFEQFPGLRGASIEEGAMWVVPWIRRLDLAMSFARTEAPLRDLPMAPSAYVHRQLWFTPFPTEPVGWMIEQAGDDLFLFSSDYPHPEGGRDPLRRFNDSLTGASEPAIDRFFAGNFAALAGLG
jgi:predicted TIM-barrel fold metal-dependent hydrolase